MAEIRAEDLSLSYGKREIWGGLNFVIDRPGLVGILGPNGVGKSSLMYVMNRLMKPTAGRVTLDGRDVWDMTYQDIARKVAYVPQFSEETFSMSVLDTVLMGRYQKSGFAVTDEDLRAVSECMRQLGIIDLAGRDFGELSGGQHQRVMIARGLAQATEVLLLDEPTSNLDVSRQMGVMKLLRDIARERQMIIVTICHDLNVASRFCDRLIMMSQGRIAGDGAPEDIITPENLCAVYGVEADVTTVDGRPYAIYHCEE